MMEEGRPPRKDVFEIDYMKFIRTALNTIGQWPNRAFGSRSFRTNMLMAYNIWLIIWFIISFFSIVYYLVANFETIPFIDAGQVYTNSILTVLFVQRCTQPFQTKFCNVLKKFALEFHMQHHEHISEFAAGQHVWTNKICRIASRIIQFQLYTGILSYNLFPLIINIQGGMFSENRPENKSFVHSVDYYLPFDHKRTLTGYFIVFAYNWFPSYNVPSSMCYYDLLLFIMVFHIFGHLATLSHSLEVFPLPVGNYDKGEKATQEYNDRAFVLLKELIKHYQIIYHFMKDLSEAFDKTLCFYLAFHQLMCCLVLLECSTMERDALGRYGVLTLVIFQQLIQTSVVFELIDTKSDVLSDQVYALPWEYFDVRNRRTVLLLLKNVQIPLGLKAGGMVAVGVRTMSTIIRTSFSYFLMLSSLGNS